MGRTLAIHWAATTHGTWLHGDLRGSWREGKLIGPDPFLEAEARARMRHDAVLLDAAERSLVANEFGEAIHEWGYEVLAATIQATHFHLVFAPLPDHIDTVVARLKYRSSAAVLRVRRERMPRNPVGMTGLYMPRSLWTGGKFPVFIFSYSHLENAIEYVRQHNRRVGLPDDPYDWITPLIGHSEPGRFGYIARPSRAHFIYIARSSRAGSS